MQHPNDPQCSKRVVLGERVAIFGYPFAGLGCGRVQEGIPKQVRV